METQEALRHQLDSLDDLQSIVRTMKALSASSIREYEQAVEALRQYENTIELGFAAALRDHPGWPTDVSTADDGPGHGVAVIFGSDHGLCGRFNEQVAEHFVQRMGHKEAATSDRPRILVVGVRLEPVLGARGVEADEVLELPATVEEITATVQAIIQRIDRWQSTGPHRSVRVFHNGPGRQLQSRPTDQHLLPLALQRLQQMGRREWPSPRLPRAFMAEPALLSSLIREYLFVRLFRACAGSQTSEHASRLNAMQRAQSNLDDRIESLTGRFRRLRQDAITSELLDVVSGFEAVNSD
ncbi:F0F1 ATP synthase subunit gamma [Spiribacter onubensis]|uniref:F0F1 ATP synthase subunit gamma n=1 Tax=Spiribacter onubensis TaxID=3122420 RepID=A0ABV3SDQ2_9GAMM